MNTSNQDNLQKEVRVGLVLYGGVSLAIYIYGVVLEYFRVVRASQKLEHNAYSGLLEKLNCRVMVDIVSGSSAGGINGVLLAKALSSGVSAAAFKKMRNIWLEAADFTALIKPGRKQMAALLDEVFFERKLKEGLEQMEQEADVAKKNGKPLSPSVRALDLFITATDLNGRKISTAGGASAEGQPSLATLEYRRVFHRKYRTKGFNPSNEEIGYDQNDFSADKNEQLVRICRATSAFPAALRPVTLQKTDPATGNLLEAGDKEKVFLTDGGVLNNKPFSDTIAAISRRSAFGKVDRLLMYVEPDPETFQDVPAAKLVEPGFMDVLSRSVMGIPRYQSLTRDMLDIRNRNERIIWFNRVMQGAEKIVSNARNSLGTPVNDLKEEEYRQYLEAQPLFQGYQDLKRSELCDRLREQGMAYNLGLDDMSEPVRSTAKTAFSQSLDDLVNEKGLKYFLNAFDAPYRTRRLFRLIEMTEEIYQRKDLKDGERLKAGEYLARLWALFDRVNQIEWRLWDTGNSTPAGWFQASLLDIKNELKLKSRMAASEFAGLKDQFAAVLEKKFTSLLENMLQPAGADFEGLPGEFAKLSRDGSLLAKEIDVFVAGLLPQSDSSRSFSAQLVQVFERFEFRDMFIYPMEVISDLGERDPIEIVSVSPRDARHITDRVNDKLAGDSLFHFGGFLTRRWRENDIMWGRLDAAEIIVRSLVKRSGVNVDEVPFIDSAVKEVLREELPGALESSKGYQTYLREDYTTGRESLVNVGAKMLADLASNTLRSLKGMLRYDQERGGQNLAVKTVEGTILWVLNLVLWPVSMLVRVAVWLKSRSKGEDNKQQTSG